MERLMPGLDERRTNIKQGPQKSSVKHGSRRRSALGGVLLLGIRPKTVRQDTCAVFKKGRALLVWLPLQARKELTMLGPYARRLFTDMLKHASDGNVNLNRTEPWTFEVSCAEQMLGTEKNLLYNQEGMNVHTNRNTLRSST